MGEQAHGRTARHRPKLPDTDTIARLAQIGRVKPELVPRLGLNVRLAVDIAWQSTDRRKLLVDRWARVSLGKVRRQARELHAAIKMRDTGNDVLLDINLASAARRGKGLDIRMADIAAVVKSLLAATEDAVEVMSPSGRTDPD